MESAELPFFEVDIREIFEIPHKTDFRPRKREKRFWRINHFQNRKCHTPKAMDQHEVLPCTEKEQNGKLLKQQLDQGQKAKKEEVQLIKMSPTSHMAVQTEQEQTKGRKASCVMVQVQQQQGTRDNTACVTVTVQQQWDGEGEVPEVTVDVQLQGQKMEVPRVTVQVQQERNVVEVACVSAKVQQQTAGRGMPYPCVSVQVQLKNQEGEIPCEKAQWHLHTSKSEAVPHVVQGQQQAPDKERIVSTEVQQQPQDMKRTNVIDSKSLEQGIKDSLVKKSLSQQCRCDQSKEQLNPVQLLQTEAVVPEKQIHDDSQDVEQTDTLNLHPLNETEDYLKEANAEQQNDNGIAFNNQMLGSDGGAPNVAAEELEKKHGQEQETVSKKHRRETPNYFVAIPITNDQILDKIEDVQELIFNKEPNLLEALIPVQTMHLTIIVAHLRTKDDVKRAASALKHSKAKVDALLQGKLFSMTFHGIGQFNNQVIYVKMSEDEQQMLSKIAEAVESSFTEMNVDITDSKDFKPHLTFLKLSKAPALRKKGYRKICEDLYAEYEESLFGTEIFSRIDLCAMHKKKQDSGYYYCECSINVCPANLQDDKNEEVQTDDLKENIFDVPLNDGIYENARGMSGDTDLASQGNDKLTENRDGDSSTKLTEENSMNDAEAKVKDQASTAVREVCSKLVPELLPTTNPASSKAEGEEQEKKS